MKTRKPFHILLLFAFMLIGVGAAGASYADMKAFLKLDGVKGESIVDNHIDEIEVTSFSWGSHRPSNILAGAMDKTPEIEPLVIIKSVDIASPVLANFATTGKHLGNATLEVNMRVKDGVLIPYYAIELEGVVLSTYGVTFGAGQIPEETVSLGFTKISWVTLFNRSKKVEGGSQVTVGRTFDLRELTR